MYTRDTLKEISEKSGVYIMKNKKSMILYIGKAKNLRSRVRNYFTQGADSREMIPFLVAQVSSIETIITMTEKEALLLEASLIRQYKPKYNALLKDDRSFLGITVNKKHNFPRLELTRNKDKEKNTPFFGPYVNSYVAKQIYNTLTATYKLRVCSDEELQKRKRPCVLYDIKKCSAPCLDFITEESYKESLNSAVDFLKGKDTSAIKILKVRIEEASNNLEFEKAQELYASLKALEAAFKHRTYALHEAVDDLDFFSLALKGPYGAITGFSIRNMQLVDRFSTTFELSLSCDVDIFTSFLLDHYKTSKPPSIILTSLPLGDNTQTLEEIFSEGRKKRVTLTAPVRGEKKRLIDMAYENALESANSTASSRVDLDTTLFDLAEKIGLNTFPSLIDCIDTSNFSGKEAVASVVTFEHGLPKKSKYRLFHINGNSDDYSAMREVITRKYKNKKADALPDLLVVDGGKGQLSTVVKALEELGIVTCSVIALTKEKSRHDKGLTKERIFKPGSTEPISLPFASKALFLLQRIRDESHRFAIDFQRKTRKKVLLQSILDSIDGIGPKKKALLIQHYGSAKNVLKSSYSELISITGITEKDANAIILFTKKNATENSQL